MCSLLVVCFVFINHSQRAVFMQPCTSNATFVFLSNSVHGASFLVAL